MDSSNTQVLSIPDNSEITRLRYVMWIRSLINADKKLREKLDTINGIRAVISQIKRIPICSHLLGLEDIETLYVIVVTVLLTLYHVLAVDDEKGSYKYVEGEMIMSRYEICKSIGKGTFSTVLLANDSITKRNVAIKLSRRIPHSNVQLRMEYDYLKLLKQHTTEEEQQFIVKTMDSAIYNGHGFIVFEVLQRTLAYEIQKVRFMGLTLLKVKYITKCILKGLQYLHRLRLVHADLKPSNIMFIDDSSLDVKIIDLGVAFEGRKQLSNNYVQTRPYRAPEVTLRQLIGPEIDIWSVGCIVAEMCNGWPLIIGYDEKDQIAAILEVLGFPPTDYVTEETHLKYFVNISKCRNPGSRSIEIVLGKKNTPVFVDFMSKFLQWLPESRSTAETILEHPFFDEGV